MLEAKPLRVGEALARALQMRTQAGPDVPLLSRLDAQRLLLKVLGQPTHERAWLLTHDDQELSPAALEAFSALIARHDAGEPMAYLIGEQEFFGLTLQVDERVLIPRPDTETLVNWALQVMATSEPQSSPLRPNEPMTEPGKTASTQVLDMGTGSGAIALALKHARPDWQVCALDASPDALAVASANAARLGLALELQQSHWFDAVRNRFGFDLIVSNPPYIREGDPHLPALGHEPLQALTAGTDGLADLHHIIQAAPDHLRPQGWLLLEHGYDQAEAVRALLQARGFARVSSQTDLEGIERCSGGQWPGTPEAVQSPR